MLFLIIFGLSFTASFAQTKDNVEVSNSNNFIVLNVPKKLSIKDKIIVYNKSPYYIVKTAVGLCEDDGEMTLLGTANGIAPNTTVEIASFRNNDLKLLRGKKIAIKAKGTKDYDKNNVNDIDDSSATYDFIANVYEYKHDLYIELKSKGKDESIMNF